MDCGNAAGIVRFGTCEFSLEICDGPRNWWSETGQIWRLCIEECACVVIENVRAFVDAEPGKRRTRAVRAHGGLWLERYAAFVGEVAGCAEAIRDGSVNFMEKSWKFGGMPGDADSLRVCEQARPQFLLNFRLLRAAFEKNGSGRSFDQRVDFRWKGSHAGYWKGSHAG